MCPENENYIEQSNNVSEDSHLKTDWTIKQFVTPGYLNKIGRVVNEKIIPNPEEATGTPEILEYVKIDGNLYKLVGSSGIKIGDDNVTEITLGEGLEFVNGEIRIKPELLEYLEEAANTAVELTFENNKTSQYYKNLGDTVQLLNNVRYKASGRISAIQDLYLCLNNDSTEISNLLSPVVSESATQIGINSAYQTLVIDTTYTLYLKYKVSGDSTWKYSNRISFIPNNSVKYGLSTIYNINDVSGINLTDITNYSNNTLVFEGFDGVSDYWALILATSEYDSYKVVGLEDAPIELQYIKKLTIDGIEYFVYSATTEDMPLNTFEPGDNWCIKLVK